ncbi:hypothetical protein SAMN04489761_3248 [Tenacibaculum sp. MAR_2009_124]|uniref:hypothetical protein n=1 Tax=Tenacibaculum sp. MAR_2009_124 TaxID=1250059 RepID=UPI00089989E4|nr:hypothetical protein [Tenacibaculum sp. MAR_2009_124]SEC53223.1 hypothetical protein SAMN04489761_3248 [Tenacibaculum sp. MAR_2009_124]
MKQLNLIEMEIVAGGDTIDEFIGGLSCGAAVAGFLTGQFYVAWIPAAGCWNYFRN